MIAVGSNRPSRSFDVVVATTTALVAAGGILAELAYFLLHAEGEAVRLFSLSYEKNVPTWYATCLLFACSERLFAIGTHALREREPFARHWIVLAAIFAYLSLDEAIELHEHLGALLHGHGLLYFSWVVPAAVIVGLVGALYLRFLAFVPRRSRRRFVVAGAIYVTGALLMELPLGFYTERFGDDTLGYALIDAVEETLELVGATLFLFALRLYAAERGARVSA